MIGVVLISGSGSNLQSLIDNAENIDLEISCVISNNPNAYGLERAKNAGIETKILEHTQFTSRVNYDRSLKKIIDEYKPGIIILAGFMRILTADFVNSYLGKIINIHPSLLPKHQGLNTHERAIQAGDKIHGASVHFVTAELDGGPIIAQKAIEIYDNENSESLAKRVLREEHKIYPMVVKWFTEGRVYFKNNKVVLDNKIL